MDLIKLLLDRLKVSHELVFMHLFLVLSDHTMDDRIMRCPLLLVDFQKGIKRLADIIGLTHAVRPYSAPRLVGCQV